MSDEEKSGCAIVILVLIAGVAFFVPISILFMEIRTVVDAVMSLWLVLGIVVYALVLALTWAMCKTSANADDAVERWQ